MKKPTVPLDGNGVPISKFMDMYEFVTRTISSDLSVTPEYILSARHDKEYVIQKHFFAADGTGEEMLYHKGIATGADTPRSIFDSGKETINYVDFWEMFL